MRHYSENEKCFYDFLNFMFDTFAKNAFKMGNKYRIESKIKRMALIVCHSIE
jgi:hypothetical protein